MTTTTETRYPPSLSPLARRLYDLLLAGPVSVHSALAELAKDEIKAPDGSALLRVLDDFQDAGIARRELRPTELSNIARPTWTLI